LKIKSAITILIIGISSILLTIHFRWIGNNGDASKEIISGDGRGYYAYLPAFFIYHDYTYDFLKNESTVPNGYTDAFLVDYKNRQLNKYTCGVALLQSPFFIVTHLICKFTSYKCDGYSKPYQIAISIAAIFYLILGLYFLRAILFYFLFEDKHTAVVLLCITFGTNLLYYAIMEPSMSHIYSFAAIAGCFLSLLKLTKKYSIKILLICIVQYALVLLIRPLNAIAIIAFPVFIYLPQSENILAFKSINTKKIFLLLLFIFVGLLSIQSFFWKKQCGELFVWSYPNEGFNFSKPAFIESLFGFRKGLFVYTPLLFVSLFGLIPLYKFSKFKAMFTLLFLIVFVYLNAAWWSWFFGSSFGLRPYIDFYILFAVLLAFLIGSIKIPIYKILINVLLLILVLLSCIQSYQYTIGIIHPETMNFEKYKYVFLKTDDKYINVLGGNNDLVYGKLVKLDTCNTYNDFESHQQNWNLNSIAKIKLENKLGGNVAMLNEKHEYSATYKIANANFLCQQNSLIKVSFYKKEIDSQAGADCFLVVAIDSLSKNIDWKSFALVDLPRKDFYNWYHLTYDISIPKIKTNNVSISIYIWNPKKKKLFIDDFSIDFFAANKH
jgi:hypothetical protein